MSKQADIIVIDDEQVIIDSVTKLCSAEGWQVESALDAVTGLQMIQRKQYQLIISDIMMPDLDGFEFLEKIIENNIQTPVIITTGYSTVENAVRSLNSGAIDYLAKPFTVDELISTVQRGLNYNQIMQSAGNETTPYIPCPPKYYRIGYCSWANIEEDGSLKIGITDLFLQTIDKIQRIEIFNIDQEIIQGNVCAHIETSDQLIHGILSPITGKIIKQNQSILTECSLLEKDPYFEGWIYTIIPSELQYELNYLKQC